MYGVYSKISTINFHFTPWDRKQWASYQLCSDTIYFTYLQRIQNCPPWTHVACTLHLYHFCLRQGGHASGTTGRMAAAPGDAPSHRNYEILIWSFHLWCSFVQLAASLRPCFNPCKKNMAFKNQGLPPIMKLEAFDEKALSLRSMAAKIKQLNQKGKTGSTLPYSTPTALR